MAPAERTNTIDVSQKAASKHALIGNHAQLHHPPVDPWHSGADSHQRHRLSRDLSDSGRSGDGGARAGSVTGSAGRGAGTARTRSTGDRALPLLAARSVAGG